MSKLIRPAKNLGPSTTRLIAWLALYAVFLVALFHMHDSWWSDLGLLVVFFVGDFSLRHLGSLAEKAAPR